MWRKAIVTLAAALVTGCAQIPPTQQEIQAKQFETVGDMAVIYIVRGNPDLSTHGAPLGLDGMSGVTTYPGTFVRWVVAPGQHRIAGMFGDNASITLQTQAGGIYYVRQSVIGWRSPMSFLQLVSPEVGQGYARLGTLIPVN